MRQALISCFGFRSSFSSWLRSASVLNTRQVQSESATSMLTSARSRYTVSRLQTVSAIEAGNTRP